MKKYAHTLSPYLWYLSAFLATALLTSCAFICPASATASHSPAYCGVLGWIGSFGSLFGPTLLMPCFFVLMLTYKLGSLFYPGEKFLILLTKLCILLAALLSVILFVVSVTTFDVPNTLILWLTKAFSLKSIIPFLNTFLFSLWLAPAGMLMMLALFMIQFGMMRETLIQGFKPILIFIVSGGVTAFTFGILSTILDNIFPAHPSIFFPITISVATLEPMLRSLFDPLHSLILSLLSPLPLLFLFKITLLDKIEI